MQRGTKMFFFTQGMGNGSIAISRTLKLESVSEAVTFTLVVDPARERASLDTIRFPFCSTIDGRTTLLQKVYAKDRATH